MRIDAGGREWFGVAATLAVAFLLALCLALGCGTAYAAGNETEMTGDFNSVGLSGGDGTGGSAQTGSQSGESGGDVGQSNGSESTSESETEATVGGSTGYAGPVDDGSPGEETGLSESDSSQVDGNVPASSLNSGEAEGIPLDDGSYVTVDDGSRLVIVGPDSGARVLDDSRTYTIEQRADGTAIVRNDAGEEVVVEGATVRFIDAEGKQVEVDVSDATNKTLDAAGASGGDETELSDETGQADAANQSSSAGQDFPVVGVIAVAVAAIAAVTGIVLWRRRRR